MLSKTTMRRASSTWTGRSIFHRGLADARARKPDLWRRLKGTQKRLKTLRQLSFQVANLQDQADRKKYVYELYWKKHEEARAVEAMANQSMVSISVVDRAVPPLDPQNPPWIPLALGLRRPGARRRHRGGHRVPESSLRFEREVEHWSFPSLPSFGLAARARFHTTAAHAGGSDEPDMMP
jgi:hypothetical protein